LARLSLGGPSLGFAGRLTAAKSVDVVLAAVARTEGVSLVLAGDGEEGARLRRLARDLGVEPRVRFLGAQPRERVLELLAAVDATVLGSSWENFPHVLVESLAVGTPVIASRVGGVVEIVSDGENGLLVPPGDPAALAAAIDRFFGADRLAETLRARARPSAERFSAVRIHERLLELLQDAGGRRDDAA
jgi:glycogen synthase